MIDVLMNQGPRYFFFGCIVLKTTCKNESGEIFCLLAFPLGENADKARPVARNNPRHTSGHQSGACMQRYVTTLGIKLRCWKRDVSLQHTLPRPYLRIDWKDGCYVVPADQRSTNSKGGQGNFIFFGFTNFSHPFTLCAIQPSGRD